MNIQYNWKQTLMKKFLFTFNLIAIFCLGLLFKALPTEAENHGYESCESVRRIMALDVPAMPYLSEIYDVEDKFLTGLEEQNIYNFSGLNADGTKTDSTSPLYAHVYVLYITGNRLQLNFKAPNLPLEYALFQGVLAHPNPAAKNYTAFLPISTVDDFTIQIEEADFYTLVVRRSNMNMLNEGSFELDTIFDTIDTVSPNNFTSEQWFNTRPSDLPIRYVSPWNIADINADGISQTIQANASSFYRIIRSGNVHQLLFRHGTDYIGKMHFGNWVSKASIAGGSLAVQGNRYLFLDNFVPQTPPNDNNESVQNDNDIGRGELKRINNIYGHLDTDSEYIKGIWVIDNCLGVLLEDDYTFIASLPQDRPYNISMNGNQNAFNVDLEIPNATGNGIEQLSLTLDWDTIAKGHEVNVHEATLRTRLATEQDIELETTNIGINFQSENGSANALTQLKLDEDLTVLLDGKTLDAFYYRPTNSRIGLDFRDSRSDDGNEPSRNTDNLTLLESFEGVIRLQYNEAAGNKEHLWLPQDYGYIELQTPDRDYKPNLLPDTDDIPTGFNNLGNECYTANTLVPDFACVHDTIVNYANGNLWYSVTDLQAYGGLIDLMLTRSYNSFDFEHDGSFGYGWTSEFLLDYKVRYNGTRAAREITPDAVENYRVGLDVLLAPHGTVIYQTPSGSRHVFTRETNPSQANDVGMEIFRTGAMPDWVLMRRGKTERERVRSSWILRQEYGFTVEFDVAGRIQWYGYPAEQFNYDSSAESPYRTEGRIVQIDYAGNFLNGITDSPPIIISDSMSHRQLELQYDENYHIETATLRDTSRAEGEACLPENGCQRVTYEYLENNGRHYLQRVNYADGTTATYEYPEQDERLGVINDPRSPFSQVLKITYAGDSSDPCVGKIEYMDGDEAFQWFSISNKDNGRVDVTKGDGETIETYVYSSTGDYQLVSYSSPLGDETSYSYSQDTQRLRDILTYRYGDNATLIEPTRITPDFRFEGSFAPLKIDMQTIEVQEFLGIFSQNMADNVADQHPYLARFIPSNINLGDGTTFTNIEYDESHHWPVRFMNNAGATYVFERNPAKPYQVMSVSLYASPPNPDDAIPELRWDYQYNEFGLVTQITRFAGDEAPHQGYTTYYQWDNLGQLTHVIQGRTQDVLRDLAQGILQDNTQEIVQASDKHIAIQRFVRPIEQSRTEIHLIDETSTSVYCFDERNRLIDEILVEDPTIDNFPDVCSGIYSSFHGTSYSYDVLDRLTHEYVRADGNTQLETSYEYRPIRTLPALGNPNDPNKSVPAVDILGYQVVVTAPKVDGKIQSQMIYSYDALNRLREVRDVFSHITRYDYDYDDVGTAYYSGADRPHIVQYDFWDNDLIARTDYFFDERNRLQHVRRDDTSNPPERLEWEFRTVPNGDGQHVTDMNMRTYPIESIQWGRNANNLHLTIRQESVGDGVDPQVTITYDYLQRPTLYEYARQEGESYEQIIYCFLDDGEREEIHRNRSSVNDTIGALALGIEDTPCDTDTQINITDFDKRIQYDGQNRVQRIEYHDGRVLAYSYAVEGRQTVVTLTDNPADENRPKMQYRYNAAGFLIQWTDSSGIRYDYDLDLLGRLLRVRVEQAGELIEDIRYTYNEANQVIRESNPLDDSELTYFYNQQGLLNSIRDEMGNVTTYAYDRFGRLTTVITPLGRTTTYEYDTDFLDIHRPNKIITGGVSYELDWQNEDNCLLVTDPQGFTLVYRYDMVGLLRQIGYVLDNENDCNSPELLATLTYDHSGILNGWYVGEGINETQAERAFAIDTDTQNGIAVHAAFGDNVWGWTTKYDVEGNLQRVGSLNDPLGLNFRYDAFSRLNQITPLLSGVDPLFWEIDYNQEDDGSLIYRVARPSADTQIGDPRIDSYKITYDNHFNWLRSDDLGIAYERVDYDDDVVYRFEQDGVEYVYQFMASDPNGGSQERVVYFHAPGQTRQYIYDIEGHLVNITTRVCAFGGDEDFIKEVQELDSYPCDKWESNAEIEGISPEDQDPNKVWETQTVIEYNAQGLPFRITENDLVETFAYDALGNVTLYQDKSGRTFRYRYDQHNRLTWLESPANLVIVLEYGADERPTAICLSDSFEVGRNKAQDACVDTVANPDWLETYAYDVLGRPDYRIYPVLVGDQNIENRIDYDYAENSRSGRPNAVGLLEFGYDSVLGRLESIDVTGIEDSNYTLTYSSLNSLREINKSQGETVIQSGTDSDSVKLFLGSNSNESIVANIQYREDTNTIRIIRNDEELQMIRLNAGGFVDLIEAFNQGQLGTLATINYQLSNPTNTGIQYFRSQINWSDYSARSGQTTYLNDNHQQITSAINPEEFTLDYSLTSTGQVQTQGVSLFASGEGYAFQMGYDEVGRPLTMQITDSAADASGEPLYLMSLSHDSFGRIARETRQYLYDNQNTLVEITYSYEDANPSQVVSSEVKIQKISNDLSQMGVYVLAPLALLGLFYSYRRRSRLILVLALVGTLGTATLLVGAQDTSGQTSWIFNYGYDPSGNLTQVIHNDETCVTYSYDSANRLVGVDRFGSETTGSDYTYTATNHLERINDTYLLYYADQHTPAFAYQREDGTLKLLGNILGDVPLYQQDVNTGELDAFYNNGLGEVMAASGEENAQPLSLTNNNLWLFDPLGRLVNLEWSANISDPCNLFTMNNERLNDLMPQVSFNGMIWDSQVNLMFDGARAYDPIIGRFLQRNPMGPDAMGNIYTYYPAPPAPVLANREDTMFEVGLQILGQFQTDATMTHSLSSTAIWERHAPVPIGYHVDSFYQDFSASSEHVQNEVQEVLALSERLLGHFRPQARLDGDGTIRFYDPVAANNPQTATTRSFINSASIGQSWMPSSPQSAAAGIESALSLLNNSDYRFRFTEPQGWRPQVHGLNSIWIEPRPNLSYAPDVTDWLLQPLDTPLLGLQTLQAAEMISEFPNHDLAWWIDRALDAALPSFPELPPNSVEEWREGWFDEDVLGNRAVYEMAWSSVEYPAIPNYSWGSNWNGPDPHIDH